MEIFHFQCFSLICKMHCNLKSLSEYTNMPYKMDMLHFSTRM